MKEHIRKHYDSIVTFAYIMESRKEMLEKAENYSSDKNAGREYLIEYIHKTQERILGMGKNTEPLDIA